MLIPQYLRLKMTETHLQNDGCCGRVLENCVFEKGQSSFVSKHFKFNNILKNIPIPKEKISVIVGVVDLTNRILISFFLLFSQGSRCSNSTEEEPFIARSS